jgi:hypothetical protein
MAHEARNDVYRGAGLEQFGSDAVPEAMNPDVNAFRSFNPECCHRPMDTVLDHVVGQVRPAVRVGEEIAVRVLPVVFGEPVAQMLGEQIGHAHGWPVHPSAVWRRPFARNRQFHGPWRNG